MTKVNLSCFAIHRGDGMSDHGTSTDKKRELLAFLFLTVVLAPALSVILVGGYGFSIWMYQIVAGPPGAN